jgi:hypothetical protein
MQEAINAGKASREEKKRKGADEETLAQYFLADHREDILEGVVFVPYINTTVVTKDSPLTLDAMWDETKILVADAGRLDADTRGDGIVVDANGLVVGTYKTAELYRKRGPKRATTRVALHDGLRSAAGVPIPRRILSTLGEAFDANKAVNNAKSDLEVAMKLLKMPSGKAPVNPMARLEAFYKPVAKPVNRAKLLKAPKQGANVENPTVIWQGPANYIEHGVEIASPALDASNHVETTTAEAAVENPAPAPASAQQPQRQLRARTRPIQDARNLDAEPPEKKFAKAAPVRKDSVATMPTKGAQKATSKAKPAAERKPKVFNYILVEPDDFDAEGRPLLNEEGEHVPFRFVKGSDRSDRLSITRKHKTTGKVDVAATYPGVVDWNDQGCITKLNSWRAQVYRRNVENYARYEPRNAYLPAEEGFLREYWRKEMKERENAGRKAEWARVLVAFRVQFKGTERSESSIVSWCSRDEEVRRIRGLKVKEGAKGAKGAGKKRKMEEEEEAEGAAGPSVPASKRARRG